MGIRERVGNKEWEQEQGGGVNAHRLGLCVQPSQQVRLSVLVRLPVAMFGGWAWHPPHFGMIYRIWSFRTACVPSHRAGNRNSPRDFPSCAPCTTPTQLTPEVAPVERIPHETESDGEQE